MAENTVVKEHLSEAMIEAGEKLTRKLDELGVRTTAAFWNFDPEVNEWKLLFASPEVAANGPRKVYGKILDALSQLKDVAATVPFPVIGLLDADADLVRLLRAAIHTGGTIGRIRFSKNVINGHFIEDALVYRMNGETDS